MKGSSTQAVPTPKKRSTSRRFWTSRTFRFHLKSFRLRGGLSLRRFSIVEAAFLLMLALIGSRILGVLRQVIFNALFGTGPQANAYYAGARLSDTLFNLVAGGALTYAFIPVFLSYEKNKGEHEAWQLASLVFNVLMVVVTFLVIIAEFLAPVFVNKLLVPGYHPSEQAITTSVARVMLWQPLILGLSTIATAILQSRRQFLLPAVAIAVYNVGLIAGLLVSLAVPKVGIYGPTYGVLVAATLQVAVQLPGLLKQGVRYSFLWNLRHPGLLEVGRLLLPNTLSISAVYAALIVDTRYTSYLPDPASLSALTNAEMLQALPVALIAQAIGQSLLPYLSLHAATSRYIRMRQTVIKVMGTSILLTIPAALLLIALGKPAIHILFQHGAFKQHSSDLTYIALVGYALALPGQSAGALIASGFYALKNAFIPFFTNAFALAMRFGLIVFLLHVFQGPFIILSIPLALAGSATAEALLMWFILMLFLRSRRQKDQGMLRLLRRRSYVESLKKPIM